MKPGDIVITPLGFRARVTRVYGPYVDVKYLTDESHVRINTFKREQLTCAE